ncbi:isoprenylcysteine carboxylmethyltransferase family protein [Pseudolabrys sp. Root1462]|uniref:methyltransferase family protein n=1 Tax=Pseudolabrys sp. Root1462 TaxID=1736466 RepID=UPI0009EC695D|nr:isoprenylcysteine carboxylmethyltransferase family protein [Pseudolabrys sp. Root1462]
MPRWLNFSAPDDPLAADTAGVIAPPPVLLLIAVLLGLVLDWLLPAYMLSVMLSWGTRILLGVELMAAGVAMVTMAERAFRAAHTEVRPWRPSTAVVVTGIFAWLRNPMYVGGTVALLGLAILLASDWMVVMAVVTAVVLHFGVIRREERYLTAKFGEPYVRYLQTVPRYGLL